MVTIRHKEPRDLLACASLIRDVHAVDRYPLHLPDDPMSFVEVPDALGAWVACSDRALVGHVCLRPVANPKMMAVASEATGLPCERLAVVARLFVSPSVRRRGAGMALLRHAAAEAWALGRQPVLDVVLHTSSPAIALYERGGWRRVGTAQLTFPSGETVDEAVYVGPPARPAHDARDARDAAEHAQ